MRKNYHIHTYRCNHADGEERMYIENAIKAGLETIGFSDHAPYIFEGDYYSSFRMRPEQLEDYLETLVALREEYKREIRILIGLEAEYYPRTFDKFLDLIRGKGLDYLIMGEHFPGDEERLRYSARACDDSDWFESYINAVIEGAKTGLFSYLAHPDLIAFTGDSVLYEREMKRMITEVAACGMPLEINLLGVREQRRYPTENYVRLLGECGVTAILGTDAHHPEDVYDPSSERWARETAQKYGVPITEEIDIDRLKKQNV